MDSQGIWSENHRISAAQTDTTRQASLCALANFLQEAAGNHASHFGLGFEDMKQHGQFWVLNRLKIEINRYPKWKENIIINTWVREMKGPFSHRDFTCFSSTGEVLLSAGTLWIALDAASRRPIRLGARANTFPIHADKQALQNAPSKLSGLDKTNAQEKTYKVRYSDLDMISHVNNVKYIEWILDTYSFEYWQKHEPQVVEVNYLGETHPEDRLQLYSQGVQDRSFLHTCFKADKEVCRASLLWRQRKA